MKKSRIQKIKEHEQVRSEFVDNVKKYIEQMRADKKKLLSSNNKKFILENKQSMSPEELQWNLDKLSEDINKSAKEEVAQYKETKRIELSELLQKQLDEYNNVRKKLVDKFNEEKAASIKKINELKQELMDPTIIESNAINNILDREGSLAYVSGAHCQEGKNARIFVVKPMELRPKRQREEGGKKRKHHTKRKRINKNYRRKSRQVRK